MFRKWDLGFVEVEGVGGAGPLLLSRLLRVAKEVRILCPFDHAKEYMTRVGGALDPNLTSPELPKDCHHHPFLLSFASTFLHLKSLAFIGRQIGKDSLCVWDEDEEELHNPAPLAIVCPNLTPVSITTFPHGEHALLHSLNRP